MLPTLENALERITQLENRISRLEEIFIGRTKLAPSPPSSTQTSQPSNNGEEAFPLLDPELMEPTLAVPAKDKALQSTQPRIVIATSALEADYPNIADNITLIWGSPECETYLNKLMLNSRGSRQGFNLDIMDELMLLTAITEHEKTDIWTSSAQIGDRR